MCVLLECHVQKCLKVGVNINHFHTSDQKTTGLYISNKLALMCSLLGSFTSVSFNCGIWYNYFGYSFQTTRQDTLNSFSKSIELVNILQKYLKSKNTWQAVVKQLKTTIMSSERVARSFCKQDAIKVRCHKHCSQGQ